MEEANFGDFRYGRGQLWRLSVWKMINSEILGMEDDVHLYPYLGPIVYIYYQPNIRIVLLALIIGSRFNTAIVSLTKDELQ